MPALRELQRALRDGLIGAHPDRVAPLLRASDSDPTARLAIYRNTLFATLSRALGLTYPAVKRLVGADFFAAVAEAYARTHPARSALLDEYGADFAAWLAELPATASLAYLGDVARLEWRVSLALHAEDAAPVDMLQLSALAPARRASVRFVAHPSLGLLHTRYPADAIWRAVLARDDAAMAAIDLDDGPLWVLVHRGPDGVEVTRLDASAARLTERLMSGDTLDAALHAAGSEDAPAVLADHLRAGRFSGFTLDK